MSQPGRAPFYKALSPMPAVTEAPPLLTRFGALALDPDRIILFPRGLLGFADHHHYMLTDIPGNDAVFKLLQSVDDVDLSFVVLPLDRSEGPIAGPDLAAAGAALAIEDAALAVLAIVTLRADAARVDFTVNLRAPLLVDTARRLGYQHVLASDAYSLRHPLPRADAAHAG
jgi:flagellar assembly factor FliW